ncbi:MAG: hypothetical protein U0326_43970 [Polyangiales bacterium]
MSALEPTPDFEDDNAFLFALLGALQGARAALDAAERAGRDGAVSGLDPVPDDDPVLLAALGVVRLASRVTRAVEAWGTEVTGATETPPDMALPSTAELLV